MGSPLLDTKIDRALSQMVAIFYATISCMVVVANCKATWYIDSHQQGEIIRSDGNDKNEANPNENKDEDAGDFDKNGDIDEQREVVTDGQEVFEPNIISSVPPSSTSKPFNTLLDFWRQADSTNAPTKTNSTKTKTTVICMMVVSLSVVLSSITIATVWSTTKKRQTDTHKEKEENSVYGHYERIQSDGAVFRYPTQNKVVDKNHFYGTAENGYSQIQDNNEYYEIP